MNKKKMEKEIGCGHMGEHMENGVYACLGHPEKCDYARRDNINNANLGYHCGLAYETYWQTNRKGLKDSEY